MMDMDRDAHLERCKRHARAYLKRYRIGSAVCSMIHNLKQHPETAGIATQLEEYGLLVAENGDYLGAQRFIEGFR